MSEVYLKEDEFNIVKHKRRTNCTIKSPSNSIDLQLESNNSKTVNTDKSIKKIEIIQEELLCSDYYKSVIAALRESLVRIQQPIIESIVSFGLGRIALLISFRPIVPVRHVHCRNCQSIVHPNPSSACW